MCSWRKEGKTRKKKKTKTRRSWEFLPNQKPFFVTLAHTGSHNVSEVKDIRTCRWFSLCGAQSHWKSSLPGFPWQPWVCCRQEQSLGQQRQTCSFWCDIYLTSSSMSCFFMELRDFFKGKIFLIENKLENSCEILLRSSFL